MNKKRALRLLQYTVAGAIALHIVIFIYVAILSLSYPFEHRDWGEWDCLYQSLLLSQGENPYPMDHWDSAPAAPYTPLLQTIAAPLVHVFGAQLWIGRVLSLLFFLATLLLVYLLAINRYHLPRRWAWLSVVLVFSLQSFSYHSIQKFHPNALCLFLGMLALWSVPHHKKSLIKWSTPLLFALLSFFAKQSGLVFIIGIVAAGFIEHKWRFLSIALPLAGVAFTVAIGLNIATSGGFQFYCFELPRSYPFSPVNLAQGVRYLGLRTFLFTWPVIVLPLLKRWYRDATVLTTLISSVVSLLAFGQMGSSTASFLFFLVPAALVSTYALFTLSQKIPKSHGIFFFFALHSLLLLQLTVVITPWPLLHKNDKNKMNSLVQKIEQSKNNSLVLTNRHLAYKAHHPLHISDEFIMQLHRTGIITHPDIEDSLQRKTFSEVIVSQGFMEHNGDEGVIIRDLILKNYSPVDTIKTSFYKSPTLLFKPIGQLNLEN